MPCLALLRRAYPGARIDWLVDRRFADAVRAHPALDGVIEFDRQRKTRLWPLLRRLRGGGYGLVVDLQGLARSGLFAWATRAPRRVGFADARELGWLGVNQRVHLPAEDGAGPGGHAIARMRGLLLGAGIGADASPHAGLTQADLALYPPPPPPASPIGSAQADPVASAAPLGTEAKTVGENEKENEGGNEGGGEAGNEGGVCVAVTAQWGCKCWPMERYVRLIERVLDADAGRGVTVIAAPHEMPGVEAQLRRLLPDALRPRVRTPRTRVGQMMHLLQRARLLVGNDSAPLHLAVGLGVPTVSLFGPTDPARVGPPPASLMARSEAKGWDLRHRVLRAPSAVGQTIHYRQHRDDDTLMRELSVDTVWDAVHASLARAGIPGKMEP